MRIEITEFDPSDLEFRQNIRDILDDYSVVIDFQKANSDIRTLRGTTKREHIPAGFWKGPTQENWSLTKTSCPIFDFESGGWRSFRWDTLLKITLVK